MKSGEEYKASLEARKQILERVMEQPRVKVEDLLFRKTPQMVQNDKDEKQEEKAKVEGYRARLAEAHENDIAWMEQIDEQLAYRNMVQNELAQMERSLTNINSEGEIQIKDWNPPKIGQFWEVGMKTSMTYQLIPQFVEFLDLGVILIGLMKSHQIID